MRRGRWPRSLRATRQSRLCHELLGAELEAEEAQTFVGVSLALPVKNADEGLRHSRLPFEANGHSTYHRLRWVVEANGGRRSMCRSCSEWPIRRSISPRSAAGTASKWPRSTSCCV